MQVKEITQKGLSHELEIHVPAGDIAQKRAARLTEVGKTVRLPGFRPGKVPMNVLEKKYGRAVMGEVLELVVNESSAKAMKDKNLRPAMQPKIEVKEFDEGKDLTFNMKVEVLPEVKVMDLKALKLEKPVAKIDAAKIDETLTRIAGQNRETKPIEDSRAAKKGDIVIIDFHGKTTDDGVMHPGMHAHGTKLELGSGQFIPGFEDQLVGAKAGASVTVTVTFPKDYGASELAGREAEFAVDVQEIHEAAPAVVNDEFAKKLGFDDEAALRGAVEDQMKKEYDGLSRMKMKRQLLDVLDEGHDFEIPQGMVEAEYDLILKQIEQERKMNPKEGDGEVSDEDKEELKAIAERRVRLGLIFSEVGTSNKVTVTDMDIQRAVIAEAQKFPGQEKMVFEFYQKNPRAIDGLKAPLFEDKVVDLIFGLASVTEKPVSVDDLTAPEDEDEFKPKKKTAKKSKK
jgi:trigger factor